ncbi:MAG TPA: Lrp/AsnC family transcriptional regulator [Roseiarcus sp.]|nr:Lrp/AsnC family transcriptional regulator [Roseiarcus sp.]
MPDSALDRFDLALLDLVQRDNLTPARALAERVGLSESAVLRRLRRLRREKIIVADVSIVQAAAIGLPLTIIVLASLERESAKVLDAFARRVQARPEVRQCWYVTGDADWVLVLQVESMASYEAFTREMFLADPNVKGFKTLVAMREVTGGSPLSRSEMGRG